MRIMVEELGAAGISQTVIPDKNVIVEAIKPHLYRHNFATGTLRLEIYDDAEVLLATSESIDISGIGTDDYFHGYIRFYVNAYLAKDEEYTIKLVGDDGYTFDEGSYCGWVNGYDLGKYPVSGIPIKQYNYPFDLEIWERTTK